MTGDDRLCDFIDDLLAILRVGEHDVLWTRFDSVDQVVAELEQLRGRISNGDGAARQEFRILCLPTGAIDDIAISSGWTENWVKLVDGKYRSAFP
ncbi:hypothetical protein [Amycolatopsis alkalitolerans]|uniref:Uncharacterized protein n=1 Tax=Amycolatopsis alkalitolerans TaxID=2547244 RepID=A0A5C4LX80_9PSEU|nr:hypothetical protein [Amycolatopsis alkalitolerans]TNC22863.1 hypothetical protein FG385_23470 [Amycolatopsis alkalitolerans]